MKTRNNECFAPPELFDPAHPVLNQILASQSTDGISWSTHPAAVPVPSRSLTVTIRGGYPFDARASLSFGLPAAASFAVDFALPPGAKSMRVVVAGQTQRMEKQSSGFFRVTRKWNPGSPIEVVFDSPVRSHVRQGRDGGRWVAFTRGPIVLAADSLFEFSGPGDPAGKVIAYFPLR